MAHGSDESRISIVEAGKHESRFDIQDPPPTIHRILNALAKECKGPVYRKHGAFSDSKALRGIVADSSDSKGEADDVVRFLKRFGCLVPNPVGWMFSAEGADRLIELICEHHKHIPRPNRTFVELFERVSDSGEAPIVETEEREPASPEEPVAVTEAFDYPETEYDDGMLDEIERDIQCERDKTDLEYRLACEALETEYRAKRSRQDRMLQAVEDEQIRRIQKRIADAEAEAELHRQEIERLDRERTERLAQLSRRRGGEKTD